MFRSFYHFFTIHRCTFSEMRPSVPISLAEVEAVIINHLGNPYFALIHVLAALLLESALRAASQLRIVSEGNVSFSRQVRHVAWMDR